MVVLHEIAHAWAQKELTDADRDAYVIAGGFESWNSPGTDWSDRGSEHAADTIAWGLLEHPLAMSIPDGPIAEANAAYRLLTGTDAPRLVMGAPPSDGSPTGSLRSCCATPPPPDRTN